MVFSRLVRADAFSMHACCNVCRTGRGNRLTPNGCAVRGCRPLITETLIPEQADEEEIKDDEHKSFTDVVGGWVSNIFDRGNKTEIEKVRLSFHLVAYIFTL